MSQPIFVGYKLKPVSYLEELLPAAPTMTEGTTVADLTLAQKEFDKAKKDWEKRVDALRSNAAELLYLSTFESVFIAAPSIKASPFFGTSDDKEKLSLGSRVGNWLLSHFPNAWSLDAHPPLVLRGKTGSKPGELVVESEGVTAYFVGFEPRMFLKVLGVECSLAGRPLPLSVWYGNSDHRDIQEAAFSKTESKGLDWSMVLAARRRGLKDKAQAQYDKTVAGWSGPGLDPERDVAIAMLLASQLGL